MTPSRRLLLGLSALLILGASPAVAQKMDVETRTPAAEPGLEIVVTPRVQKDVTRPTDYDFYPEGPRVQHEPAFIEPLSGPTEDGRSGISGWTSPHAPVGPMVNGRRDVTGWLAVGFSLTWGGPPTKPAPAR